MMLCILDGWGMKTGKDGDALSKAKLPNFDQLWQNCPHTTLNASGAKVGLPAGIMGNSEVGHLNIGAGRVVYQDLTAIDKALFEGEYFQNEAFRAACNAAIEKDGNLHLMGLLSDGGVHSHINHLKGLLLLAKTLGVKNTYIHCFMDGRDVAPTSGVDYITELEAYIKAAEYGEIGVVIGRFYAMDRDKRWDRVEKAWQALVLGAGEKCENVIAALEKSYEKGVTDEFIEPLIVNDVQISDGDSVIFFNYRADRAREISRALADGDFTDFQREKFPIIHYTTMTQYDETFNFPVAFPKRELKNTLGEVLEQHNLKQLRIAETEKYAHVTFFFNGGVEEPNVGEERILVPSPKVQTYDLSPKMSALEITENVLEQIQACNFDVIILNFANPDMVGHTGIIPAAIEAVETVDHCLGKIVAAINEVGGVMLVTADHGNVECLRDDFGNPVTSHTTSLVPLILVGMEHNLKSNMALCDIAPTMLELLEIQQPSEMTGESILA